MHNASLKYLTISISIIAAILFAGFEAYAYTVVIDAGHGGKDIGAQGESAMEKDINLAVALKLGKMIERECKNVKVIYTRSTDVFVPLQKRCDIANKTKGNLFISIHTNSVDESNPNRKNIKGTSVYTLGLDRQKENLDVAKRENSVMTLEKDYTTTYCGFDPNSSESYIMFEMNQNRHIDQSIRFAKLAQSQLVKMAGRTDKGIRQDIFWVLVQTGMPAVLVELDFICNPMQEKFMSSSRGQEKLAKALCKAFKVYHSQLPAETKPSVPPRNSKRKSKTNKKK